MKMININNKEYKIEFTIEASLYKDCTERVSNFLINSAQNAANEDLMALIGTLGNVPESALIMFYAGLLENHGADGDGSVTSIADAKKLIKQMMKEYSDKFGNFYDIMMWLIEIMGEDDFFKQTGIAQLVEDLNASVKPAETKKKTTKVTKLSEN